MTNVLRCGYNLCAKKVRWLCGYHPMDECIVFVVIYNSHCRASERNFARRNKTALGPRDRLKLLSKLRILGPIKPLVYFNKCFISCAAECPDNIYFIRNFT